MRQTDDDRNAPPDWLTGVLPVLPTPFTAEDEVDLEELCRLVDFAAACGVRTVVTPAFGSEFYKLDGGERQAVIEQAVAQAAKRELRVVVQCNHPTPRLAGRLAAEARSLGAAAVATALPRTFAAGVQPLADYARHVCGATDLPVIVQDWNPGGKSADASFFVQLHNACPNLRMVKLEEPDIGAVIRTIARETQGRLGVLSGWGGSFAIQQHHAGLAGLMPGLGLADVFVRLWMFLQIGDREAALALLSEISPYLQFSLQTFEQFHHSEKRLLVRRQVLKNAHVRSLTVNLDEDGIAYLSLLTEQLALRFPSPQPNYE